MRELERESWFQEKLGGEVSVCLREIFRKSKWTKLKNVSNSPKPVVKHVQTRTSRCEQFEMKSCCFQFHLLSIEMQSERSSIYIQRTSVGFTLNSAKNYQFPAEESRNWFCIPEKCIDLTQNAGYRWHMNHTAWHNNWTGFCQWQITMELEERDPHFFAAKNIYVDYLKYKLHLF